MIKALENRFYYLENFQTVLAWIAERYSDLLTDEEQQFIAHFPVLPTASRALLVRMVMRKGDLFRASKLTYEEIGCTRSAAQRLVDKGWVDDRPFLTLEQLFTLLRKPEISEVFGGALVKSASRKADQLEALRPEFTDVRRFAAWYAGSGDCVYQIRITGLCDRLRLMFFGNLYQDWSEFVLSDLGIFTYEKVAFSPSSRAFQTRRDVDDYLHLHQCRERFLQGEPPEDVLAMIPRAVCENDWLEKRRAKLLFHIAQHYEQLGALPDALTIYLDCGYEGARLRAIRVMEKTDQLESAFELADAAQRMPESEAERQQLSRILPRLRRKLGQPKFPPAPPATMTRIDLALPKPGPDSPCFVEELVREHLTHMQAPVHYVENTLINSLFGLLCWNAVFTAVPGAFFHPFHSAPADLHSADFHRRREREFTDCLSQLESEQYKLTIMQHFIEKSGIQSPFVFWEILSEELLELALACIPAAHLKKWFDRILLDIKSNRAGFPDLIRFWPEEKRYQMIEVKGPGDRLQDNQIRWIDFCATHDMPVTVCYVQWLENSA
jgi:hypothetical protein